MASTPLRELFAVPVFRQWALANVMVRIPVTMNLLSFVLAGEYLTGSVSTGALLAGVGTLAAGLSARWRGAQLDRVVLKYGLIRQVVQSALACGVLAALVAMHAPLWMVFALAITMGFLTAAITGGLRALLIPTVPGELLEAANSVDAVLVEVAFVSGPVVAGIIGIFFDAPFVIATQAFSLLVGVLTLVRIPSSPPNNEANLRGRLPLFIKGATTIYLMFFIFGVTFGIYDGALPEYVQVFGWKTASSGLITALISFGSGVGGVIMANRRGVLKQGRWLILGLYLAFAVTFALPAHAPDPILFGVALFMIGLPIAPLMSVLMLALQHVVPKRQQAESFALASAVILVAAGAGLAITGYLMRSYPWADAHTILTYLFTVPLAASICVGLGMLRRHLQGKPQSMGFPLDPDIANPDL